MIRESVLHMGKYVTIVVVKTTLNQNVDQVGDLTQTGQEGLSLLLLENVASVAIRRWTVLNTVKKNRVSQIQTQMNKGSNRTGPFSILPLD